MKPVFFLKSELLTSLLVVMSVIFTAQKASSQCATVLNAGGLVEVCDGEAVNLFAEIDIAPFFYNFEWLDNGVPIPGEGGPGDQSLIGYVPTASTTITVRATHLTFPACPVLEDNIKVNVRTGATFVKCTTIDDFEEPGTASTIEVAAPAMGGPTFATVTKTGSGMGGILGNVRTNNLWYISGSFGSRADVLEDTDVFLPSPPNPPSTPNPYFGEWFYSSSNDDGNESNSELLYENGGSGLNWDLLCGCENDPSAAFRLFDYFADQSGVTMTITLTDNTGKEATIVRNMPGSNFGSYNEEFALVDFTADAGFNWCEIDKISLFMDTNNISVDFKFRQLDFCKSIGLELGDGDRKMCLGECIALDTLFNCPIPAANISGDMVSWTDENGDPVDFDEEICPTAGGIYDYEVTVVDELGCQSILTQRFTVCDTPSISIADEEICKGESVTLMPTITGGNAPLSYSWSPSSGLSCTNCANPVASPTSTKTYTLVVSTTESGDNGDRDVTACSGSTKVRVKVNPLPNLKIEGVTALCDGAPSTEICASTNNVDYIWSTGATTKCIDVAAGTFSVTVTDGNGCTAEESVTVEDVPSPSVTATSNKSMVCEGSAAILTATGAGGTPPYTYEWSTSQTGSPISVMPSAPSSTYIVTVSDKNGCTGTNEVTVDASPNTVDGTVTVVDDICNKKVGSATANPTGGSPPYTFMWNTGATTQTITGLGAGTYTVTITDLGECEATASGTVGNVGGPSVDISGAQPICEGESVTLTANPSGGKEPYSYEWSPGGATTASITVSPNSTTTYSVVVTDDNDCTAEDDVEVVVNDNPTIVLNPTSAEICEGSSVSISVTVVGGTPDYTYAWTGAGLSCNDCPDPDASPATTTTYTLLVTDDNGCSDEKSITVKVNPNPSVSLVGKVNEDCGMENGSITVSASGGTPGYSYEWNTNPVQTTATATGLGAGSYTVTVTDSKGCKATLTESIINQGGPTVTIDGPAESCIGDDVTLTANPLPFPGDYSYQWSAGLGTGKTATVTNVQSTQDYSVTVTDNGTSCTAEATFTLKVVGCAEVTHDKEFVSVVQTGLNTYDVTYEIVVENIGTGDGEYILLDSLAFDPDVVVNTVNYSTDAPGNPGNPGPVVPNLDGDNRYELAIAQAINDTDPHTYTVVVGVTLDLNNPPAGGNGEYNPCNEAGPDDYVPEFGLYNLSILDTPNDIFDERAEACGDLPIISHEKSGPVIVQTGARAWDVTYTITVKNTGYGPGKYGLVDRPTFDDDIEYTLASYTSDAPGNAGNPGPQGLFGQGPWTLATGQDIAAGPNTEHVYTITVPVKMDLEDAASAGDEVYTECGNANGQNDPIAGEGLFNQSELDVDNDGIADEFDDVCGDLPYIVHEKTSTTPSQIGPNAFEVVYTIKVTNLGGADGEYDLEDAPNFDDDFVITSAAYSSDAPGNGGSALAGNGPWSLADDQTMAAGPGSMHTYTVTVQVTLDLSEGDPTGDNTYTECGSDNGQGDPEPGEGLFNESRLDVNNDGTDDETSETCEDVPYIEHEKTLVSVSQNPDDTYDVEYQIKVTNRGAVAADYGLFDEPKFDDDIVINSAEYSSTVHGLTNLGLPAPSGGWQLGDEEELAAGEMHFYTVSMNVSMDLNDPNSPGDRVYWECGRGYGIDDPRAGEGLFNEAGLDTDNDDNPDVFDDACGDIPFVTHFKEFVSAVYNPVNRTYDVTFKITVDNKGGAEGQYDLFDEISFEDDFVVNSAEYDTDAPGHPANGNPTALFGTNWTLANDQSIIAGGQHMYTIRLNVEIDLSDPDSPGDEIYTECGYENGPNDPQQGEGLYNMSRLDRSNDGIPEEEDEACGDVEIVDLALRKTRVTGGPFVYGQPITFNIEVFNQGNIDMTDIYINDYMPDGYTFLAADNDIKWSQSGPNLLVYNSIANLAEGASTNVTLVLRLAQSSGATAWDNYAEIASMKDVTGADRSGDDIDSTPGSDSGYENSVKPGDEDDDEITEGGQAVGEDEDDHDPANVPIFDLALIKQPGDLGPYSFGQSIPFDITVINQGNTTATDIEVFDYVPEGYIYDVAKNFPLDWSYTGDPVNIASRTIAEIDPLEPGEQEVIRIWLIITNTDGTNPDAWTNYAEIMEAKDGDGQPTSDIDSTPNGDNTDDEGGQPRSPNDDRTDGVGTPGDDEDDHDPAIIDIFDLALRKTVATPPDYAYGQTITFDIWVFNQGNLNAENIVVTDYIPEGYSYNGGWNGAFPAPFTTIPAIPAGDSAMVSIDLTLEMTDGGNLKWINYAEITSAFDDQQRDQTNNDIDSNPGSDNADERGVLPGDPRDDDIQSTDKGFEEDDHDPAEVEVFDLAQIVVIDNEQPFYSYGDDITFKLTITNQGNVQGQDIKIVDYVPDGFIYDPNDNPGWSQFPTNEPTTLDGLDLDPGETKMIFITLELKPTDEIDGHVNYTEIESANGDDGLPRKDIDSEPDTEIENDEGGMVDTPNDNRLDGDGTIGDDEDDHDPARPRVFDLAQIKQVVTQPSYTYGQGVVFEFTVVNQGNVPATNITVTDSIPEGFSFVSGGFNTGWSDTYPEIEYTISDTLFEKDTHRIQVELILEKTSGGVDKYTNLSEISAAQDTLGVPGDDADSDPDSEFDNDAGGEPDSPNDDRFDGDGTDDEDDEDPARIEIHDLALRKTTSEVGPFDYTDILTIDLWVYNQGNETATNVEITEYIPIGFGYQASNNNDWSYDSGSRKATLTSLIPVILPGDSQLVQIDLELLQAYDAEAWDNYAEISDDKDENGNPVDDIDSTPNDDQGDDDGGEPNGPTDDEINEESPVDEDDHDPYRPDVVDLALNKKVPNKELFYVPGDTVPFKITVYNQGNVDVQNTLVRDYIPEGFIFDNTIPENTGWDYVGQNLEYTYGPVIESQDSAKIDLFLVVQIPASPTLDDWRNYAEIAGTEDTNEVDRTFDDADSNPGSDADHERAVMDNDDGDPDDDNVFGDYKNKGEDEDDHDPEEVEVTGALGDKVWKDLDGDGIQDDGEPGVEGVIVTLYTCEGEFIRKDTTDSEGLYFFDFLIPLESYYAVFDISPLNNPDCVFTFPNEGVNDSLDSDVNAAGIGPCTFIEPGERDSTYDAGLVELASIGDFVWHDRDADGVQEGGDEEGIEGVTVRLYDNQGTLIGTTQTNSDGYYLFDDLMPMEYYLEFEYMDMWSRTPSNVGNDNLDSDVDDSNGPNTTATTDLDPGEDDYSWDLGLYKCIPVGDFVWFDLDADGIQDAPENGINGVRVYLYDANDNLIDQTVSGADPNSASGDGYWKFCVDPGTYYVVFERPGHLAASGALNGNPETDSDITHTVTMYSTYYFTVRSGDMRCDIDGGFHSKATMGDRVWLDANGNGIQDGGEPRVEGVTITAYDENDRMFWQDVSDQNGEFYMDGLSTGDYYLKFDPPAGYTFTIPDAGQNDGMDSDVDGSNGPRTTALYRVNPGEHEPDVDGGLVSGFLPVELLDFRADWRGDRVQVSWRTGVEINNDYYEVERRHESERDFSVIGVVQAAGTVYTAQDYRHDDYDVKRTGVYYYRLRQVDTDGTEARSEVRVVEVIGEGNAMSVFPNPASDVVNIKMTTSERETVKIELQDELGRILPAYAMDLDLEEGTTTQEMNVSDLPAGMYTVRIITGSDTEFIRFTKID